MKWIITKDLINAADMGKSSLTAPGLGEVGRYDLLSSAKTVQQFNAYANELPLEFRLLDADDEVYFEGRCSAMDLSADPFAPLDSVGEAYGCVTLEYRQLGASEWVAL